MATTIIRVVTLRAFDRVVASCPETDFSAYIDVLAVGASGSHEQVGEAVQNAADVLHEEVENMLFFSISEPKAALIASTPRLAKHLRLALDRLAGPELVAVRNLAVDATAGKRRAVLKTVRVRARRIAKCQARIQKTVSFTTRRKASARNMFVCGVMPAAMYCAEVIGISNTELAALQAMDDATGR